MLNYLYVGYHFPSLFGIGTLLPRNKAQFLLILEVPGTLTNCYTLPHDQLCRELNLFYPDQSKGILNHPNKFAFTSD